MAKRYTLRGRDSGASPAVKYVSWEADTSSDPYPGTPPFGGPIVDVVVVRDGGVSGGGGGSAILSGSGAPASEFGDDGALYIDTSAHELYGPKAGGAWGEPAALLGPGVQYVPSDGFDFAARVRHRIYQRSAEWTTPDDDDAWTTVLSFALPDRATTAIVASYQGHMVDDSAGGGMRRVEACFRRAATNGYDVTGSILTGAHPIEGPAFDARIVRSGTTVEIQVQADHLAMTGGVRIEVDSAGSDMLPDSPIMLGGGE